MAKNGSKAKDLFADLLESELNDIKEGTPPKAPKGPVGLDESLDSFEPVDEAIEIVDYSKDPDQELDSLVAGVYDEAKDTPPPFSGKLPAQDLFNEDSSEENVDLSAYEGEVQTYNPDEQTYDSEVETYDSNAEASYEGDREEALDAESLFPEEASDLRKNVDHTQKIPMAEPFEVSDSTRTAESDGHVNNVVDLKSHLRSSNYLEVAQNRVLELEKEVQKLRRDGEQLAVAGKHFKELTAELKSQVKLAESKYQNMQDIAKEEKKILMQSLEAKEIKISALQERIVDVEQRQGSQNSNVRIRERELENRLEIMKTEHEAMVQFKDEMILDLKRQINAINTDLEKYRVQNQKMSAKVESKEELLRRTVKALRIALTMLEGSSDDQ